RYELASIGAGNMAEGIISAVLDRGVYPREAILVSDPVAERRQLFASRFGVAVTDDNRQLVAESKRIMLAVKPQGFAEVAASVADCVRPDSLFISIMAGQSVATIAAALGSGSADVRGDVRVVRVMPNLPICVGAGMAGIFGGSSATADDVAEVQRIFNAGGGSIVVSDESLMDAVTAISGSGPAYFYFFVEAMVEGGKACGLTEAESLSLAKQTALGAARMMLEMGDSPADLRAKVTSKGGTTQAALDAMRQTGVDRAIRDAVIAAFRRGQELSRPAHG
ncbi:MAG: pyrroline-5-carboxylate reductase, partial [Phycisphaerae bacterium]|nr:pyrroline-5-carboxylate reductase [Phycisphaerae bacterium]